MDIFNHFNDVELTNGQKALVADLEGFFKQDDKKVFILKGYAGVGKTFITKGITNALKKENRRFYLLAPTGKAAKVISKKTSHQASTIHQAIYDYYDNHCKTSDKLITSSFIKTGEKANDKVDEVFIIDEASMISNQFNKAEDCYFGSGYLFDDLIMYIDFKNNPDRKLVFIGDDAQLPPVKCNYSPALSKDYIEEYFLQEVITHQLTEVVRQKSDSGVMFNSLKLRENLNAKPGTPFPVNSTKEDIIVFPYRSFIDTYMKVCKNSLDGTDDAVIIASSNRQVSNYNDAIRRRFFNHDAPLQKGDKLLCVSNFKYESMRIFNGDFMRVTQISPEVDVQTVRIKTKKGPGHKYVELRFQEVTVEYDTLNGSATVTKRVLLNLLESDSPNLTKDENNALYQLFISRHAYLFNAEKKDMAKIGEAKQKDEYYNFLRVKYGYAITCHKAQGSEWKHVFVDSLFHMGRFCNYFRWLYTAITRTSDKLYILDSPCIIVEDDKAAMLKTIG